MTRYQDCDNALMCLLASPPQDGDVGGLTTNSAALRLKQDMEPGNNRRCPCLWVFVGAGELGRTFQTNPTLSDQASHVFEFGLACCMSQFKNVALE
jgi:hypothetical protein